MVYVQFRTYGTRGRLAWIDHTTGPPRRGPVAATGPAGPTVAIFAAQPKPPPSCGRSRAGHAIQGRSILGPAGVLRYPSTSLLRATPAPHLLYSPQPQQICQTGKVPAYGTLPPTWVRLDITSIAIRHTVPKKMDIHLYTGTNGTAARRQREGGQRPPISPPGQAVRQAATALRKLTDGADVRNRTGPSEHRPSGAPPERSTA